MLSILLYFVKELKGEYFEILGQVNGEAVVLFGTDTRKRLPVGLEYTSCKDSGDFAQLCR